MPIKAVVWDVDNVWYNGISTSLCIERSTANPKIFLTKYLEEGLFTEDDVKRWGELRGKGNNPIKSIKELAECLTDFLYNMRKENGTSIITKEQTMRTKQMLLAGLTMKDIREIADTVNYTKGLKDAVQQFKRKGIYQAAFSDGLAAFVSYKAMQLGINHWETVPTIVKKGETEMMFANEMVNEDSIKLTGKIVPFNKSEAMLNHMKKICKLSEIAIIDDSGANVEMLRKIHEEGGIAIAFNPTDEHLKVFKKEKITILQQEERDIEAFTEIVMQNN